MQGHARGTRLTFQRETNPQTSPTWQIACKQYSLRERARLKIPGSNMILCNGPLQSQWWFGGSPHFLQ